MRRASALTRGFATPSALAVSRKAGRGPAPRGGRAGGGGGAGGSGRAGPAGGGGGSGPGPLSPGARGARGKMGVPASSSSRQGGASAGLLSSPPAPASGTPAAPQV